MRNFILTIFILVSMQSVACAGIIGKVLKGVAIAVLSDVIEASVDKLSEAQLNDLSRTAKLTTQDSEKIKFMIRNLVNPDISTNYKLMYYANDVDYFSAGVVDHNFILRDRSRFDSYWIIQNYSLTSIDEIEVSANKKFAVARYTVRFAVKSRTGKEKSGTSKYVVLIGGFGLSPKIHLIKEWVSHDV